MSKEETSKENTEDKHVMARTCSKSEASWSRCATVLVSSAAVVRRKILPLAALRKICSVLTHARTSPWQSLHSSASADFVDAIFSAVQIALRRTVRRDGRSAPIRNTLARLRSGRSAGAYTSLQMQIKGRARAVVALLSAPLKRSAEHCAMYLRVL